MLTFDRGPVTAFLPCRAGSERVVGKNVRTFTKDGRNLTQIKLEQLAACDRIDRIIVSTNDEKVKAIAEHYRATQGDRIVIDARPDHLCSSSTSTDELIVYASGLVDVGHLLWTHVTSPFFDGADYADLIQTYDQLLAAGSHTSAMTVTKAQEFIWNEAGPINYDRGVERWPRTQTLKALYVVNSAAFLIPIGLMRERLDRISDKVFLYEIDKHKSMDIDWPEDFILAARSFEFKNGD